jgi:hypothetical protein
MQNKQDFTGLIDRTSIDIVKKHLNNSKSPISQILIISPPNELDEVASKLYNLKTPEEFESLLNDGLFKIGTEDTNLIMKLLSKAKPLSEFSDDCAVDVIYLPPFYLIKPITAT